MGIISVLNEMKVEEQSQNLIAFGTSKTEKIAGLIITLASIGMFIYLYASNLTKEFAIISAFCLLIAFLFCAAGLFLMTTQQYVVIDKIRKRVELEKFCLFLGKHKRVVHFNEINKLEIAKSSYILCSSDCGKWFVKAYLTNPSKSLDTECMFFSSSYAEAIKVARLISFVCNCEIYNGGIYENAAVYKNKFKLSMA